VGRHDADALPVFDTQILDQLEPLAAMALILCRGFMRRTKKRGLEVAEAEWPLFTRPQLRFGPATSG